jgi:hypothetical protein
MFGDSMATPELLLIELEMLNGAGNISIKHKKPLRTKLYTTRFEAGNSSPPLKKWSESQNKVDV